MNDPMRIAVVGGAGRAGLPLSLLLAEKGFQAIVIDNNMARLKMLETGEFPFVEEGGAELLQKAKGFGLTFSTEHKRIAGCDVVILTVETPIDEHLNPNLAPVYGALEQIRPHLREGQVLVLRSTLFPGTSKKIHALLHASGLNVGVSFCPERIAQGRALKELQEFPQIISASDPSALAVARKVFSSFACEVIELSMTEAEVAKLFTNTWRYIKFAIANQFYMIAVEKGLDFYRIRDAMVRNYRRAADFPVAGFAAGPCLFKDTMQLAAYNRQNFPLGHAAMLLNESLPDFIVDEAKRHWSLAHERVGILGMAYKADSDDSRESLAYKLRKLLLYENAIVMCTDPYIKDPTFHPLEQVLQSCKILFIGCPHSTYRHIKFDGRKVIDCWGLTRSQKLAD